MRIARSSLALALVTLFQLEATPSFGWGDLGHSTVGEIAERLLSPPTQAKVRRILNGVDLAEGATWPDLMRSDPDFKNTEIFLWHFVDLDTKTGKPRKPENAIWAIHRMEGILSGTAEPFEVTRKDPKIGNAILIDDEKAVKFLAHFIGDIHQPLHVGNERDEGANKCPIKWFGSVRRDEGFWNLHVVWDEGLLEKTGMGRHDLANDLLRRLDAVSRREIAAKGTPEEWAEESSAVRPQVYPQLDPAHPTEELKQPYCDTERYKGLGGKYAGAGAESQVIKWAEMEEMAHKLLSDPEIPRLGYDYRAQHIELAKMQLLKAGVRLASSLERVLARRR